MKQGMNKRQHTYFYRYPVYCTAVRNLGSPAITFLDQLASSTILPQELSAIISGRACANSLIVVQETLAMARNAPHLPQVVVSIMANPARRHLVWEMLSKKWYLVADVLFDKDILVEDSLEVLLRASTSLDDLASIRALLVDYGDTMEEEIRLTLERMEQGVVLNRDLKAKYSQVVEDWYRTS